MKRREIRQARRGERGGTYSKVTRLAVVSVLWRRKISEVLIDA